MKFQLFGYQTEATADIVDALQEAQNRFTKNGKLTAVSLSAPTAAGKTVIATAVIERLLFGHDTVEPNPSLTVLWVTDDPSLNEQTKRKMLFASSQIKPKQLETVTASLDQRMLDPGKVYFVHIQQLGKGATNYVKGGTDKRQYSIWDTIGSTIAKRGTDLLLIIDEAHRGTRGRKDGEKTITARLIDGAGGKLPPVPVVLGISATPQRFVEAMSAAGQRTLEPITVDSEAVRESGLLKDKIRIKHPTETQPGDSTLLEMAVADLKTFDQLWRTYADEQDEPLVTPAMVIQVKPKISSSAVKAILDTLANTWASLEGKAIGHSLQEHTTLNLGTRSVRYVAPEDIQDDSRLRVVLFKEALTTGWDCPRAEVMLSFRSAKDYTYIAQLIGRMVRTPLARRIATNEVLNTVALYLPYFDEEQVGTVVNGLLSEDITSTPEVDSITCGRNPKVPSKVWNILGDTPTYTRPAKHHRNEVARLNALATLLTGTALDINAMNIAQTHIVATLDREANRMGKAIDEKVQDFENLDYQIRTVDYATGVSETESSTTAVNSRNIEDLFRRASRQLGDAAAKWYWYWLCDDGIDPDDAKLKVAAVALDPSTAPALEAAAKSLIDAWRTQHNADISRLPDAKRAQFYNIWQQAKAPEQITLIMPSQITASERETKHPKHVYANNKGQYPATYTGWEADVLSAELARAGSLVAWYRNPTGGNAAIAVPYEISGKARTMYPDFLFFHEVDGEIVTDLVDPHAPYNTDTGPKWTGLSEYAVKHRTKFRRIAAVIKNEHGKLMSVDLKDPIVAEQLKNATTEHDVRKVFADYGGPY